MLDGSYQSVVDEVFSWYRGQRNTHRRIRVDDTPSDRIVYEDAKAIALDLFPSIEADTHLVRSEGLLVFPNTDVTQFSNAPYARLHSNLQKLRRGVLTELFDRASLVKGLPGEIKDKIKPAWRDIIDLEPVESPKLDFETITNLANARVLLTRLGWERFMLGFTTCEMLLKRTLAARMRFAHSVGLGYNQATLLLTEHALIMLDTIGDCTPWRINRDLQNYKKRVSSSVFTFTKEEQFSRYLRSGGMWSDEMVEADQYYCQWLTALETGTEPIQNRPAIV